MPNDLVSIIIPIYNGEKVLIRCLDSLQNQDYKNLEVIMVDDGSKDNSAEIINEYAAADKRFKAFHLVNGGVSKARNFGLTKIHGSYLMFIDCDDCLPSDSVSASLKEMEDNKVDMVIFSWKIINSSTGKESFSSIGKEAIYPARTVRRTISVEDEFMGGGYPWNRLTKIKGNLPQFDEKLNTYEDKLWVMQVLKDFNNVFISSRIGYNYYVTKGSLSHQLNGKKAVNYLKALKTLQEELLSTNDYTKSAAMTLQILATKALYLIFKDEKDTFMQLKDKIHLYHGLKDPIAMIESLNMFLYTKVHKKATQALTNLKKEKDENGKEIKQ